MTPYQRVAEDIGNIVTEKNAAYGDAQQKVSQIISVLYPDGVPPSKLHNMLLITRVLDKVVRLACGDPAAFEESPWRDIAGYGVLGCVGVGLDINRTEL